MSKETVESLFKTGALVRKDEVHSMTEERFIAMGEFESRIIFVSFTLRKKETETLIRVISSRFVHTNSKEEKIYEEAKKIIKQS